MHKSRLAGFIIDCRTDDLAAAADFWGRALGMEIRALPAEEGEKYVRLVDRSSELHIEVQKVDHPSRVHLDIETDDIEAEVRRLESLGARRVAAGAHLVRDGGADRPALLRGAQELAGFRGRRERVALIVARERSRSPGRSRPRSRPTRRSRRPAPR